MSREVWEQPTALGSTLRRFIWLLIRTIPSYLRDRNEKICMCLCKLESGWVEQKQHLYVPCSLYIPQSCCRTLKHSGNSHFSIQWGLSMVVCDLCGVNRNNETNSLWYTLDYTHLHQCEFSQYFSDFSALTMPIPAGISQNGSQLPKRVTSTDGCFFMQKPPPQVSSI